MLRGWRPIAYVPMDQTILHPAAVFVQILDRLKIVGPFENFMCNNDKISCH